MLRKTENLPFGGPEIGDRMMIFLDKFFCLVKAEMCTNPPQGQLAG